MAGVGGLGNAFSDSNEFLQVTENQQVIPQVQSGGLAVIQGAGGVGNPLGVLSGPGSQVSAATGRFGFAQGAGSIGASGIIRGRGAIQLTGENDIATSYDLSNIRVGKNSVLNINLGSLLGSNSGEVDGSNALAEPNPSLDGSLASKVGLLTSDFGNEGSIATGGSVSGAMNVPDSPYSTDAYPLGDTIVTGSDGSSTGGGFGLGNPSVMTIGIIAVIVFIVFKYLGKE